MLTMILALLGTLLTALLPLLVSWLDNKISTPPKTEKQKQDEQHSQVVEIFRTGVKTSDAVRINSAFGALDGMLYEAEPNAGIPADSGGLDRVEAGGGAGRVHSNGGMVGEAPSIRATPIESTSSVQGEALAGILAAGRRRDATAAEANTPASDHTEAGDALEPNLDGDSIMVD